MIDKTYILYLAVVMATECQSQLPYPVSPRFVVPVGYVQAPDDSDLYPRGQYLTFYGQTPVEDVPDEYAYDDYYSDDPVQPVYSQQNPTSDLLMKYILNAQRRTNEEIELKRRNHVAKHPQPVASENHSKGQKEFAMYRTTADGRRARPAWYPSLEDQLSRVKGRDQELTTKKPEIKGKKDELTVQLDKLKQPKV